MKTLFTIFLVALLLVSVASAIPNVGDEGTYNEYKWIVCRADEASAWISANNGGEYNPNAICESLGYAAADQWGGTCGDVCGFCGKDNYEYYDGAGGDADSLSWTVHWRCAKYVGDGEPDNEVPEFGLIGAAIAIAAIGAFALYRRKK